MIILYPAGVVGAKNRLVVQRDFTLLKDLNVVKFSEIILHCHAEMVTVGYFDHISQPDHVQTASFCMALCSTLD